MENNIYNIEDYYRLLVLQKRYEDGLIDEDEMTLDEINSLINLYKKQNRELKDRINKKILLKYKGWSE